MAKKIVWTVTANAERLQILEYWFRRNKSKTYSIKLNKLIVSTLHDIRKNPLIGRKTDIPNVRVKIVRDYLLFYEITSTAILVLSIWDGRRNKITSRYS
jgi:plasmid stabilization system protein ParE